MNTEIATFIGFGMLIIFLIAVIISVWRDTQKEKRHWEDRNKYNQ